MSILSAAPQSGVARFSSPLFSRACGVNLHLRDDHPGFVFSPSYKALPPRCLRWNIVFWARVASASILLTLLPSPGAGWLAVGHLGVLQSFLVRYCSSHHLRSPVVRQPGRAKPINFFVCFFGGVWVILVVRVEGCVVGSVWFIFLGSILCVCFCFFLYVFLRIIVVVFFFCCPFRGGSFFCFFFFCWFASCFFSLFFFFVFFLFVFGWVFVCCCFSSFVPLFFFFVFFFFFFGRKLPMSLRLRKIFVLSVSLPSLPFRERICPSSSLPLGLAAHNDLALTLLAYRVPCKLSLLLEVLCL